MNVRFERACENDAMLIIDVRNKSFYDDFIKFVKTGARNSVSKHNPCPYVFF